MAVISIYWISLLAFSHYLRSLSPATSRFLAFLTSAGCQMMRIEWTGKLWSDPLSIVLGTRNSSSRAAWREIEKGGRRWGTREGGEEIDDEGKRSGRTLLEASIGRDQPSCWELLAAVPPGDKPLPATELPWNIDRTFRWRGIASRFRSSNYSIAGDHPHAPDLVESMLLACRPCKRKTFSRVCTLSVSNSFRND